MDALYTLGDIAVAFLGGLTAGSICVFLLALEAWYSREEDLERAAQAQEPAAPEAPPALPPELRRQLGRIERWQITHARRNDP